MLFRSGGVLIGKENLSNTDIVVMYITEPMIHDKQKHNRFFRKDEGHVDYFSGLYKNSMETLRYIGEWHTHPEDIPNYSSIDLKNWKNIKYKGPDNLDYYHLIVGYKAIRIWTFRRRENKPELITTILWEEVIKSEKDI